MSLVRLNIKSRIELETRVLAAALKQSFERGDAQGVSLAHRQLFLLLKDAGRPDESGVATVHFTDGVPPGLPVAAGGESPSPQGGADGEWERPYASSQEPAMPAMTAAPGLQAVDPLFSIPSSANQSFPDNSYDNALQEPDSSGSAGDRPPAFSKDMISQYVWDDGAGTEPSAFAGNAQNSQANPTRADTADLSSAAAAPPGSLAARLYAEPLFGEHKPSESLPATDRKGQKTTLDRLPAARVTPDANIDEPTIGELDKGKQADPSGADVDDNDAKHRESLRQGQRIELAASKLAARTLGAAGGRDSAAEEATAFEANANGEPQPADTGHGHADDFFPAESPPAALSPEAALAQLAQSGYGMGGYSSYNDEQALQVPDQQRSEGEDSSEDDDDAFSQPGGIVDAHFVMTEDGEGHSAEAQPHGAAGSDALTGVDEAQFVSAAAPDTVPDAAAEPDRQTAPEPQEQRQQQDQTEADDEVPPAPEPTLAPSAREDDAVKTAQTAEQAPPQESSEQSQAAGQRQSKSEPTTEPEPEPEPRRLDVYMLLDVSQMSPFEDIHRNFLRKVRRILREIKKNKAERFGKLAELQRLWIAHDILTDPVTRTDYDFRDMGLRGSPDAIMSHAPEDQQQARLNNRTPLRIGELLQCAGLLEPAELEIACDMHRAMPEMQFGTFLVRQGFIQERDLESVLLGQKLLRDGAITVAQFQVAMELSQSRGTAINDTLIEKGYISQSDLESMLSGPPADSIAPPAVQIREIVLPKNDGEHSTAAKAPTWRDQLGWGRPEGDAAAKDEPVGGGLGGLLKAQAAVRGEEAEIPVERVMKIRPVSQPDTQLDAKNAMPSWQDQLDWADESKPVQEPATGEQQMAPEQEVSPEQEAAQPTREQAAAPALRVSNAVPTWQDQLDWTSPSDEAPGAAEPTSAVGISTSDNETLEVGKDLEFAPMNESAGALREAAQHTVRDDQAVDLESGTPVMRVQDETTYEGLPTLDLDNDMHAAIVVDVDAFAATDSDNDSIAAGRDDTAVGAEPPEANESDTLASAGANAADDADPDDDEESADASSSHPGRRDKKKKGKDKRKKKR